MVWFRGQEHRHAGDRETSMCGRVDTQKQTWLAIGGRKADIGGREGDRKSTLVVIWEQENSQDRYGSH